jgi:hypothetical protein
LLRIRDANSARTRLRLGRPGGFLARHRRSVTAVFYTLTSISRSSAPESRHGGIGRGRRRPRVRQVKARPGRRRLQEISVLCTPPLEKSGGLKIEPARRLTIPGRAEGVRLRFLGAPGGKAGHAFLGEATYTHQETLSRHFGGARCSLIVLPPERGAIPHPLVSSYQNRPAYG